MRCSEAYLFQCVSCLTGVRLQITSFYGVTFADANQLYSSVSDKPPVAAGEEEGELGEYRQKLLFFLETSSCYNAEQLISDFPFDGKRWCSLIGLLHSWGQLAIVIAVESYFSLVL